MQNDKLKFKKVFRIKKLSRGGTIFLIFDF